MWKWRETGRKSRGCVNGSYKPAGVTLTSVFYQGLFFKFRRNSLVRLFWGHENQWYEPKYFAVMILNVMIDFLCEFSGYMFSAEEHADLKKEEARIYSEV